MEQAIQINHSLSEVWMAALYLVSILSITFWLVKNKPTPHKESHQEIPTNTKPFPPEFYKGWTYPSSDTALL